MSKETLRDRVEYVHSELYWHLYNKKVQIGNSMEAYRALHQEAVAWMKSYSRQHPLTSREVCWYATNTSMAVMLRNGLDVAMATVFSGRKNNTGMKRTQKERTGDLGRRGWLKHIPFGDFGRVRMPEDPKA